MPAGDKAGDMLYERLGSTCQMFSKLQPKGCKETPGARHELGCGCCHTTHTKHRNRQDSTVSHCSMPCEHGAAQLLPPVLPNRKWYNLVFACNSSSGTELWLIATKINTPSGADGVVTNLVNQLHVIIRQGWALPSIPFVTRAPVSSSDLSPASDLQHVWLSPGHSLCGRISGKSRDPASKCKSYKTMQEQLKCCLFMAWCCRDSSERCDHYTGISNATLT